MLSWPASLPQFVEVEGYAERPAANVIREPNESGPANQRRRSTAGPEPIDAVVVVTDAERQAFVDFHRDDIGNGALAFDWVHPVTRAPATVRLRGGDYTLTAISGKWFRLRLPLEVMP